MCCPQNVVSTESPKKVVHENTYEEKIVEEWNSQKLPTSKFNSFLALGNNGEPTLLVHCLY